MWALQQYTPLGKSAAGCYPSLCTYEDPHVSTRPSRYICIHGHFYQPPRENPWLEAVEVQDSAAPFHDWNERVHRECYAPNTRSRFVDSSGRIINLLNNY